MSEAWRRGAKRPGQVFSGDQRAVTRADVFLGLAMSRLRDHAFSFSTISTMHLISAGSLSRSRSVQTCINELVFAHPLPAELVMVDMPGLVNANRHSRDFAPGTESHHSCVYSANARITLGFRLGTEITQHSLNCNRTLFKTPRKLDIVECLVDHCETSLLKTPLS